MPGNDDHDLARGLPEERVEASEESTPPEASEEASEESTPPEAGEESTPPEASEESTPPEASDESTPPEASDEFAPPEASDETDAGRGAVDSQGRARPGTRSGSRGVQRSRQGFDRVCDRDVLSALQQARDTSAAAIRSRRSDNSVSSLGAVASKVSEAPTALGGDVLNALQQARDSSTAAIRSAVGESTAKQLQNGSPAAFRRQYHSKVFICLQSGNALVYVTRSVSARSVPSLVSTGAIYPVPAGGCSDATSLD